MSKKPYAAVEMRKVKSNCETDSYRNSRFNAVKHGGYSTAFLSLSKADGVNFKIPPIDKGAGKIATAF